jgi:Fe-S oxidoreductase
MTTREGNLLAPTRHPLDWTSPQFYDEAAVEKEMERVFDICHGCRRCVSLCQAFPTLFDLVDNSKTMEVDGVAKSDYPKVVEQCYLCDLCYMTKCPYVPPHPWNVDFPHVMLRAKAVGFRKKGSRPRDRFLTSTDRVGKLATIPVVVQMVNAINGNPAVRKVMEKTIGVAAEAHLPPYDAARFRDTVRASIAWPVRNGERTPGKVALFAPATSITMSRRSGTTSCASSSTTKCRTVSWRTKSAAVCRSSRSATSNPSLCSKSGTSARWRR